MENGSTFINPVIKAEKTNEKLTDIDSDGVEGEDYILYSDFKKYLEFKEKFEKVILKAYQKRG